MGRSAPPLGRCPLRDLLGTPFLNLTLAGLPHRTEGPPAPLELDTQVVILFFSSPRNTLQNSHHHKTSRTLMAWGGGGVISWTVLVLGRKHHNPSPGCVGWGHPRPCRVPTLTLPCRPQSSPRLPTSPCTHTGPHRVHVASGSTCSGLSLPPRLFSSPTAAARLPPHNEHVLNVC